jgi:hypothetical protein
VHKAAQVIPFEHAPNAHTVTHTDRHTFGEVDIVCNKQRYAVADIDDEALVARAIVVIG